MSKPRRRRRRGLVGVACALGILASALFGLTGSDDWYLYPGPVFALAFLAGAAIARPWALVVPTVPLVPLMTIALVDSSAFDDAAGIALLFLCLVSVAAVAVGLLLALATRLATHRPDARDALS